MVPQNLIVDPSTPYKSEPDPLSAILRLLWPTDFPETGSVVRIKFS